MKRISRPQPQPQFFRNVVLKLAPDGRNGNPTRSLLVIASFVGAGFVVELPQTPEADLKSSRAACGRRMSWSQLMDVCS